MNRKRVLCAGGCGTWVLRTAGECRKCRRYRLLLGKRIFISKAENRKKSIYKLVVRSAKQAYKSLPVPSWKGAK